MSCCATSAFLFSHIAAMASGDNEGRLFNIALSYQVSKIYESEDARVIFVGAYLERVAMIRQGRRTTYRALDERARRWIIINCMC